MFQKGQNIYPLEKEKDWLRKRNTTMLFTRMVDEELLFSLPITYTFKMNCQGNMVIP